MKKIFINSFTVFVLVLLLSGCEIKYKPASLMGIVYNTQTGTIKIEGSIVVPTLIGEFEFSTTYPKDFSENGDFILIIRDRRLGVDQVYAIDNNKSEKIDIAVSGKARISFENGGAIIEVLEGDVVVINFMSVSKEDISWRNAPFSYYPFKLTQKTLSVADMFIQHPGFLLFCPSFIIGIFFYILIIPAVLVDLILYILFGFGLLLGPFGLRNAYYVIATISCVIFPLKKLFYG